eukprot:gene15866-18127_t
MKKRWGIVKQQVYRLLSTTENESKLPSKLEAAVLEAKLKEYIEMLTKKNQSITSAKTTEITSSCTFDETSDLNEASDLVVAAEPTSENVSAGSKRKEPSTNIAPKTKRVNDGLSVSPAGTSVSRVSPIPSRSTVAQPRQAYLRYNIDPSSDENDMSMNTETQFAPENTHTTLHNVLASSSANLSVDSEADREIWQTYLHYNDPDLPYNTKLPSLNAPTGVATVLRKKYNMTHKVLSIRLQRLWRTHQQHRVHQPISTTSSLAPGMSHTSAPIEQEDFAKVSGDLAAHLGEHPNRSLLESETDRQIWEVYLKYNNPDTPITSGQPSFRAQRGVLQPLREKLHMKGDQMQQRLIYLWYKYQQLRASSQASYPGAAEPVGVPPRVPTPVPHVKPPPAPPAPPAPLPSCAPLPAVYCFKFTAAQNEALWEAFMKQRQYRRLPPRRLDNFVGENLLSVAFVTEQARGLRCKYTDLRAHLKSVIFAHQTPKTTFSAEDDDFIWSTFQQQNPRDCKQGLVTERLQTLITQRSVTPDGTDVVTPEPVPRLSQAPIPAVSERAHVPIPHSATTNAPTVLPICLSECQKKSTSTSAEDLAAQLDAGTPLAPSQPSSRYVTRSRVATTSRALQEVNDVIWAEYTPFDSPDMHLQELPRRFLPDLANRLNLPTSVVKERLRGLILEHHPPPPPPPVWSAAVSAPEASARPTEEQDGACCVLPEPVVKQKRKRRRSKEEMTRARELQMMQRVPAAERSAPPATAPHDPLAGLMAALTEAAKSLGAEQSEEVEEVKDEAKNDVHYDSEGNSDSHCDRDGDAMSILTASDVSDIGEQDSKLHSVLSSRFIYTPMIKPIRACASASAPALDTLQSRPPAPQTCAVDMALSSVISDRSPSLCSTAASSASVVSSVTTDSSCGPFPLPFSPREDAYLWGVALPAYYNNQPLTDVYNMVQKKLNRTTEEVSDRMVEL